MNLNQNFIVFLVEQGISYYHTSRYKSFLQQFYYPFNREDVCFLYSLLCIVLMRYILIKCFGIYGHRIDLLITSIVFAFILVVVVSIF